LTKQAGVVQREGRLTALAFLVEENTEVSKPRTYKLVLVVPGFAAPRANGDRRARTHRAWGMQGTLVSPQCITKLHGVESPAYACAHVAMFVSSCAHRRHVQQTGLSSWQGAQHTLSQAWQWSPSFPVPGTTPVLCHSHSYNLPCRSRWLYHTLSGISPAGASVVQTVAGMLMGGMADLPQFTQLPSCSPGKMLFMLAAVWLGPTCYRPFKAKAWAATSCNLSLSLLTRRTCIMFIQHNTIACFLS